MSILAGDGTTPKNLAMQPLALPPAPSALLYVPNYTQRSGMKISNVHKKYPETIGVLHVRCVESGAQNVVSHRFRYGRSKEILDPESPALST